jgi:hypothetical protein
MTFAFDRVSFKDQFQELEKTGQWLNRIGVKTENTRFDELLRLNKEIIEYEKKSLIDELIQKHDVMKLWFALTEATSFISIYDAFKHQESHLHPRSKLRRMLEGPYYSWDEDVLAGNIDPRSTLFELETASKFKSVGAKIIGFDDVDLVFKKTKFNVQCKRLHSEKKVRDNLSEAARQFYKKIKIRPNLKGIICLSIDKLSGREGMILKVNSPDEIRPKLADISIPFLAKYGTLWHNFVNTNILAVLIFVHVIAVIKETPHDLLTTCCDIAFDVIPRQNFYQLADYNLIVELGERLQGTLHSQLG